MTYLICLVQNSGTDTHTTLLLLVWLTDACAVILLLVLLKIFVITRNEKGQGSILSRALRLIIKDGRSSYFVTYSHFKSRAPLQASPTLFWSYVRTKSHVAGYRNLD